jgi:hypothetical protein
MCCWAQFCSFSIIFQVNEKLKRVNWLGILLEREVFLCCEVKGSREERGEREGGFVMICLELRFGTWEVVFWSLLAQEELLFLFLFWPKSLGGIFAG